jgi:hypothetical protein
MLGNLEGRKFVYISEARGFHMWRPTGKYFEHIIISSGARFGTSKDVRFGKKFKGYMEVDIARLSPFTRSIR